MTVNLLTANGNTVRFGCMALDLADDEVLSTAEAAQIVGVTVPQLRRLRDKGAIPYVKAPGGHPRYRRSAIEAYARSVQVDIEQEEAS